MSEIIEKLVGGDSRIDILKDEQMPEGWKNVVLLRGEAGTVLFGHEMHDCDRDGKKAVYAARNFAVDTRDMDASEVACAIAAGFAASQYNDQYRRPAPPQAFGAEGRHLAPGTCKSIRDESIAAGQSTDAWDRLLATDGVRNDGFAMPGELLAAGAVVEGGKIRFKGERADAMAPVVDAYPLLFNRPDLNFDRTISDIERGREPSQALARGLGLPRANVLAMHADNLARLGIDVPISKDANQTIRALTIVPEDKLPQTPADREAMVEVMLYGENVQLRGLRADAASAFLEEASTDWGRAHQRIRSSGPLSLADTVWEAIDAPGSASLRDERKKMSILPDLSLREATHLSKKKNDMLRKDRLANNGLPRTLPDEMPTQGGTISEILHMKGIETLGLAQGIKKTQKMWSSIAKDLEAGDAYAFAVHDTHGAPIAAIIAHAKTGQQDTYLTKIAKTSADRQLVEHTRSTIHETVLLNPAQIQQRRKFCEAERPKVTGGNLEYLETARRLSRETGQPTSWTRNADYLPPVLKKLGTDGLKAHYERVLQKAHLPAEQAARDPARRREQQEEL